MADTSVVKTACRINKKKFGNQKKRRKRKNKRKKLVYLLSSTLCCSLWRQEWCLPKDWRYDDTPYHTPLPFVSILPPFAIGHDHAHAKSPPLRGGWLRRLYEMKLGQADSRQAESGRDSRVVQAFSTRSSPLETTPRLAVALILRRHSNLKDLARFKNLAKFGPRWNREVQSRRTSRKEARIWWVGWRLYQCICCFSSVYNLSFFFLI